MSPARRVADDATRRRERQLEQEQAARVAAEAGQRRLRFLADSIPQQVWTASPDGRIDEVNRQMIEYFGVEAGELVGEAWLERVHPEDRERVVASWREARAAAEPFEAEVRLRRADGRFRWHLTRAVPQVDGSGRVLKWFGTNTDLQDRKEAEAERDRALAELARSNRELDQFAYVASHDLRAPLRGISNLSQWLEEDLGDALTAETAQQLALLRGRVARMESLIDGLLQYSRAGRRGEEAESFDLRELALEVVDLLSPPPGMRVELTGDLPRVRSHRLPLQQVLLNLVGNAVKHHDRGDGEVEIGGRPAADPGRWEIWVRDDGPGIAPEYQERIWTIFQTLRSRDEVEGTGIGLAVVRKIVDGRGGRVWLESAPGEGTTFRVLWPLEERDE